MASRRKYMQYLRDPDAQLPKSTKYRHLARIGQKKLSENIKDDESQTQSGECEQEAAFDFVSAYTDMFNFQQQISAFADEQSGSKIELENLITEDLDSEQLCDLESEWDEVHIDLEDDASGDFSDREPVIEGSSLSFHDLAVLLISLKSSFNLSSIVLSFIIKIISLILPRERRGRLRSLKQLYSYFNSQDLSLRKHYYCSNCEFYLGLDRDVVEKDGCPSCHKKNTDKYFVDIPLEAELQKNLERNWKHLDYRFDRNIARGCVSDVYDGELYQKHFAEDGFLHQRNNVSLLGNTDGVAIFKSSSFSVWPVYVVVNELPPKLRFRRENRILCGLWFGKSKPNFSTFFKPFTEIIWKLCTEGFQVTVPDDTIKPQTCKALLLQMSCDSPAKCLFQGFMQFNAYYGCPYCLNPGEYDRGGRSHIYPYIEEIGNGFGETRTHEGTVAHARIARENLEQGKKKFAEKGVKGMSWAFSLPSFDIIDSMCLDYMHGVLLGVMKQLIKFWCTNNELYSLKKNYEDVQSRLLSIPPPNNITRAPRSLDERKHWKASEYRSFLLFYGPVCLHQNLDQLYYDHFLLLSSAVWLLLQENICQEDLEQATRHLQYFTFQMSTLYGSSAMTFSVHLLLHLPNTVIKNGPLWCQSCFFFEDYNGELRQFFHSSQHPDSQVVRAVSIMQKLPEMVQQMVPDSPAETLQKQMTSDRYKTKCLTEVENDIHLVGQPENTMGTPTLREALHVIHNPFFDGEVKTFKRALIKGQMFHSASYMKVTQRNSYTVEFADHKFGEILYYVLIESSAYAFIREFKVKSVTLCKDDLTGTLGRHLTVVDNTPSDPVLVPLSTIRQKAIIMKIDKLGYSVIARFPNFIERD